MPLLEHSSYRPPTGLENPHLQIVLTSLARIAPRVIYTREQIPTPDGDHLELDWVTRLPEPEGPPALDAPLLLIFHGLESHARLPYIAATAMAFLRAGWRVAALNFRDCGDTPNKLWQSYHSGVSQDAETAVRHVAQRYPAAPLGLLGYSLGGNVMLRYLTAHAPEVPAQLRGAVAISVPVDVRSAVTQLTHPANSFYNWRFMQRLRWKLRRRCERFPGMMDSSIIPQLRTFRDFDELYTAPAHGFPNAEVYWREASSAPHLEELRTPTLLVNALDDPFLGPECYPRAAAQANPRFHVELPAHGSHVGFLTLGGPNGEYWHETRAREFLTSLVQ